MLSVLLDIFPWRLFSILFWQSSSCSDSTAVSKEGRIFFAAYLTVDFRRSCEVNWTFRLVQVARRMLLPETFTNLILLQFASSKTCVQCCVSKNASFDNFYSQFVSFQNCNISCAKKQLICELLFTSCSKWVSKNRWNGNYLICLKFKVIFMEMAWAPRFTLKPSSDRGKQQQKRTIVQNEDDYGFVALLQRHCLCMVSVIFPHVPPCNILFLLQSTNDFYLMFSHILLTTFVYQISIILPKPRILSCKNSRQMSN